MFTDFYSVIKENKGLFIILLNILKESKIIQQFICVNEVYMTKILNIKVIWAVRPFELKYSLKAVLNECFEEYLP